MFGIVSLFMVLDVTFSRLRREIGEKAIFAPFRHLLGGVRRCVGEIVSEIVTDIDTVLEVK